MVEIKRENDRTNLTGFVRELIKRENKVLSNEYMSWLSAFIKSGNSFSSAIPAEYASRLRFIPAKGAIASKASLLCAVLPDSVHVICDGKRSETDVLIAPVAYKLSAGESRALLPPGIIQ